jgi:hypothetical protein
MKNGGGKVQVSFPKEEKTGKSYQKYAESFRI